MWRCEFELNGQRMSLFKMGRMQYHAFSGDGTMVNRREDACRMGGAIPPNRYWIVARQSGGLKAQAHAWLTGRNNRFALYAADGRVDDQVFCNRVERGEFRLHPRGPLGRSKGCVVIDSHTDFARLRQALLGSSTVVILGTEFVAYGILEVR